MTDLTYITKYLHDLIQDAREAGTVPSREELRRVLRTLDKNEEAVHADMQCHIKLVATYRDRGCSEQKSCVTILRSLRRILVRIDQLRYLINYYLTPYRYVKKINGVKKL